MSRDPLVVMKFGSSVLRDAADLPAAVHEIYREVRRGRRVLAVVSAFAGETDRLLRRARRRYGDPSPAAVATLLATGELTVAAHLQMALDQAGVPAGVLDPATAGLETTGPRLDARPVSLDTPAVLAALDDHAAVVMPGFLGRDADGAPTLLGRGGSDLTAMFLARQLGAEECRLLKDVDGLHTADPAVDPTCERLAAADWSTALELGGELVQPKALRYARAHRWRFRIAAPGGIDGTEIGTGPVETAVAWPRPPRLRVALLGLGAVGLGVWRGLRDMQDRFEVVGIAVRDRRRRRDGDVPRELLVDDPWRLLAEPADVVVELIGGRVPAGSLLRAALGAGRDVVTGNKEVMARSGPRLEALARSRGSYLRWSAAVGGAAPVLEGISRFARDHRLRRFEGVLNGTCNFVLDRIAAGSSLDEAVREAQECGFAEADPSLDLGGGDSAAKLSLAARAAWGLVLHPERIACEGLEGIDPDAVRRAARRGRAMRLVASLVATERGVEASVGPRELPATHPLAAARGEENRVLIAGDDGETLTIAGKGAGRWPTAEAVIADLLDIQRVRAGMLRSPGRTAAQGC